MCHECKIKGVLLNWSGLSNVIFTVQLTRNLNVSKKNSRVSSARHASSRARVVFECEGSSARARVIERSSARGQGLYRARRRHAESGSLQHAVITVHIELPVLESHVAPIMIIQRNYRYKLANMLYACYSSSNG